MWTLLIALAAITPIISTIYWGIKVGGGVGALIGIVVGLVIGFGNFYGISAAGKGCWRWAAYCKEQQRSMDWTNRLSRLLVLAVFFWIFISGLLGVFITQGVVKIYH